MKSDLTNLIGLIIPGGESTNFYKLCEMEKMWGELKQVNSIFGTCAGAIMLAKTIKHKEIGQQTLELMDITIDRNAYGRQTNSFEAKIKTSLGNIKAVFIRAPKITAIGRGVKVLAKNGREVVACEQKLGKKFYLAACFHPELTTTTFHEYWLKQIIKKC
jgi:5'-phosphate synthase pdxT subunit